MIVVADTSPINYLVLIDAIHVLPALYEKVIIPKTVSDELQVPESPQAVRDWTARYHEWLTLDQSLPSHDPELDFLDAGESHAIRLVQQLEADALIIDDRAGRSEAMRRGIVVIGTLGVLSSAAESDLIDLEDALGRLQKTSFRASPRLVSQLLQFVKNQKEGR
jgi:predicted nucleic acid-binding protein